MKIRAEVPGRQAGVGQVGVLIGPQAAAAHSRAFDAIAAGQRVADKLDAPGFWRRGRQEPSRSQDKAVEGGRAASAAAGLSALGQDQGVDRVAQASDVVLGSAASGNDDLIERAIDEGVVVVKAVGQKHADAGAGKHGGDLYF
jgi:hypothetical protein